VTEPWHIVLSLRAIHLEDHRLQAERKEGDSVLADLGGECFLEIYGRG
jgi:hypothetical protein